MRVIAVVISREHLLRPYSRVHLRGHECHLPNVAAHLGYARKILCIALVAVRSIAHSAFLNSAQRQQWLTLLQNAQLCNLFAVNVPAEGLMVVSGGIASSNVSRL